MSRIVIVGGPRTGKTTYSEQCGLPARHTDDVIGLGWSEASLEVARWFDSPGPWCIEGVATARALRKWLALNPVGKPCDSVRLLWDAHVRLTPGQLAMSRGVETVWIEIAGDLQRRGVQLIDPPSSANAP